jgi:hypothetical protein
MEVEAFRVKLDERLDGAKPSLVPAERMWLQVFDGTAAYFPSLTRPESYDESLRALSSCFDKGIS